jgi:hypothetical protein
VPVKKPWTKFQRCADPRESYPWQCHSSNWSPAPLDPPGSSRHACWSRYPATISTHVVVGGTTSARAVPVPPMMSPPASASAASAPATFLPIRFTSPVLGPGLRPRRPRSGWRTRAAAGIGEYPRRERPAGQPDPRVLNWMATILHPAGWRIHTRLSRTDSSIGSPRQDARLRCTQRTIAASP